MLTVTNIKKYYTLKKNLFGAPIKIVRAVDDVSLTVEEGESLCLVGESGCGKTTLARMIMRLIEPSRGDIIFKGENITKLPNRKLASYRRHVQMVFQDPYSSLDPRYTVRQIIKEGMTLGQGATATEQGKEMRIQELIRAVGLHQNMLTRYPHEFSGGERQRIAIARSLALNPKLLILDEAVSSLDVLIQQQVLDLLKNLQKQFELTYLFITHNLRVVKKFSTRIAVMYKGKIIELGPSEAIFKQPIHSYTKELLCAALDYKTVEKEKAIKISPRARLIDQGGGHFVINE